MKNKLGTVLWALIWLITVVIALYYPLSGNMSFWYDPARDLLSAWANLSKVTLIGPPSGIPGFFYGPYWIWWLSFGLIFSKNPSFVAVITTTLPYLFGFAGILFLFSKLFGKVVSISLWVLFFTSFLGYMTQLWNPYLAPILYMIVLYLLVFYTKKTTAHIHWKSLLPIFIAGLFTGISLNIHISFSVGFTLGCILFFVIVLRKRFFLFLLSFLSGIVIMFIPFFLFEVRHGFHQSRIAIHAFLQGGDVVLQRGFSKPEIMQQFLLRFTQLVKIPFIPSAVVLGIVVLVYAFVVWKNKVKNSLEEKYLLLLLSTITFSVLGVYLIAKNPIWDYHFDGAEVLWLLFIGLLVAKVKPVRYAFYAWVVYVGVAFCIGFFATTQVASLTRGSLYTKEYIVKTIRDDAHANAYTAYAYSPSIYTYEYNYLFRWIAGKEFSYDPGRIEEKGQVYLILPVASKAEIDNFIHYHTPDTIYKTTKIWHIPDGTTILKRSPE